MTEHKNRQQRRESRSFSEDEVKAVIDSLQRVKPSFKLLSREQAADFIRSIGKRSCTGKTLANLASDGKGPRFLRLGNETFYLPSDIESWVLDQRIDPRQGRRTSDAGES